MIKKCNRITLFSVLTLMTCALFSSLSYAFDVAFPATQIEKKKVSVAFQLINDKKPINLDVNSVTQVSVGNLGYFSQTNATIECKSNLNMAAIKLVFNPNNGLYYWGKFGVGNYELKIPSATVDNTLSSFNNAVTAGIGVKKLLFPDTIVTPAVSVEVGVEYSKCPLTAIKVGDGPDGLIDDELTLTEIQAAFTTSKRIQRFEPYGGLKVTRTYATLNDKTYINRIFGTKDNVSLFAGTRVKMFTDEYLTFEASFIGETNLVASCNIEF